MKTFCLYAATALSVTSVGYAEGATISRDQAAKLVHTTENSVGCKKIAAPPEVSGAARGMTVFYFERPSGLEPEKLTNDQLHDCGLSRRPGIRRGVDAFKALFDWRENVREEMSVPPMDALVPHWHVGPSIGDRGDRFDSSTMENAEVTLHHANRFVASSTI